MRQIITHNRSILANPFMWLIVWGGLTCGYVWSLKQGVLLKNWDHLVFLLQLACDITIGIFGFLAFKLREKGEDRRFYLIFFISIIPGLLTNEIYNILINIIDINRTVYSRFYWSGSYFLFLAIQLIAWWYLLRSKSHHHRSQTKKWLTTYPYLHAAVIICLSLVFIALIKHGELEYVGNFRMVNSILEIAVFTLMSLCLSRTKNSSLIWIETGFSLLVGFNFAHRFSDMLSTYYKAFNIVWMLSLVVISYGLIKATYDCKRKIHFYPDHSLHVLTSGAFLLFSNFILTIFIIAFFGMSLLQVDKIPHIGVMALDIPSALVFSYCLTVLLAKYLAYRLSRPLDLVVSRIDCIAENNGIVDEIDENYFQVDEVQRLEAFILKTISELHRANQVKSDFLMNMSHDFRTPASGIQYMSKLIYDKISDPDLKRLQKMIVNSSEQLMVLLEDVLDYSRLENDKLKLNYQHFDMINLIDDLVVVMAAKAQERNLTLVAPVNHKSMAYFGDQTIIKRIVLNLLSNAIKFTHFGEVSVAVNYNGNARDQIIITVKDTGIGIDSSNHDFIFEPFCRVESADSAKYSGIGLGLSNVKLALKRIGGDISLVSALGIGSEFIVTLPISEIN